jgi:hypothetical protein
MSVGATTFIAQNLNAGIAVAHGSFDGMPPTDPKGCLIDLGMAANMVRLYVHAFANNNTVIGVDAAFSQSGVIQILNQGKVKLELPLVWIEGQPSDNPTNFGMLDSVWSGKGRGTQANGGGSYTTVENAHDYGWTFNFQSAAGPNNLISGLPEGRIASPWSMLTIGRIRRTSAATTIRYVRQIHPIQLEIDCDQVAILPKFNGEANWGSGGGHHIGSALVWGEKR